MDFTPYVEDVVIKDEVSHKLDRPLFKISNKFWIHSTQSKTPTSPFQIYGSLTYTNLGQNEMVEMVDIKYDLINLYFNQQSTILQIAIPL